MAAEALLVVVAEDGRAAAGRGFPCVPPDACFG